MSIELHGNADGYVLCPLRGEISVDRCEGCPYRASVHRSGLRAVVTCNPADSSDLLRHLSWSSAVPEDREMWS